MANTGLIIQTTFKVIDRFDRVLKSSGRAKNRTIKRAASLTRSIMRRSIRYRKRKKSEPGRLPFTHVRGGGFSLRSIFWAYDERTNQAIVGPVGSSERTGAPKALELGGRSNIKLSPRLRRKYGRRYVQATIQKRSFANPAINKFADSYPDLFKGSVY